MNEFVARNGLIALDSSSIFGPLTVIGSSVLSGSLTVTQGITGSLFGTSSWATNVATASYIQNAVSSSFASTASFINTLNQNVLVTGGISASSYLYSEVDITAQQNLRSLNSSGDEGGEIFLNKAVTNTTLNGGVTIDVWQNRLRFFEQGGTARGYYIDISNGGAGVSTNLVGGGGSTTPGGSNTQIQYNNGGAFGGVSVLTYDGTTLRATGSFTGSLTGSLLGTASWAQNTISSSFASTASSADNFLVRGTLTAQTIVAQTITSSTDFVTGSTRFGSLSSNTHQFTGSVSITGSLDVNGSNVILSNQTSSMSVATASFATNSLSASFAFTSSIATSASFASTASYVLNAVSSSFAATASYANSVFDIGIAEFNSTSSTTTAGTTAISSINTGSFTSAFYNYTISSGSNARAGQVMSVWNGTTVRYTEVITADIGNTATASLAVAISGPNVRLNFTAPGVWTVKSITNLL